MEKEIESKDMRLSIVKPISAKWMIDLFDFLAHPQIIKNGFKHVEITEFLDIILILIVHVNFPNLNDD